MNFRPIRFILGALGFLLFAFPACAQLKITASITVTNKTTNGMVFTLNGDTRTFTNNVANPATMVLTNADTTGAGSKTNLLGQIQTTPFAQVRSVNLGSNSFSLVGNADLPMALTLTAGYAAVSYSTQTVADVIALQGPISALPTAAAMTNVSSDIVGAISAPQQTNVISQASTAVSELMGKTNSQTVSGAKTFTNAAGQWFGIISNSPAISGTVIALAGGLFTAPIINGATITNGANYGNAFSSPGSGLFSEQFGNGATATAPSSSAFGRNATASGTNSTAGGTSAVASGYFSTAYGSAATASGFSSTAAGLSAGAFGDYSAAFGYGASAVNLHSSAIGTLAASEFNDSSAFGYLAATTATNQVMLGGPTASVVVPNTLTVGSSASFGGPISVAGGVIITGGVTFTGASTNGAFSGTNNFLANSDIAFTRKAVSSLANGGNAAIPIGTNVFIEVSGPSGSFSIDGIANGRDGKLITLLNQTGFQMTINNESGTDPTAANRIRTLGSSGNLVLTNAACMFIYNANVSRWILLSHNP